MPNPLPNETKEEYIPRCVSFMIKNENRKQNQAFAICYSLWKRKDENILNKIGNFLNEIKKIY